MWSIWMLEFSYYERYVFNFINLCPDIFNWRYSCYRVSHKFNCNKPPKVLIAPIFLCVFLGTGIVLIGRHFNLGYCILLFNSSFGGAILFFRVLDNWVPLVYELGTLAKLILIFLFFLGRIRFPMWLWLWRNGKSHSWSPSLKFGHFLILERIHAVCLFSQMRRLLKKKFEVLTLNSYEGTTTEHTSTMYNTNKWSD